MKVTHSLRFAFFAFSVVLAFLLADLLPHGIKSLSYTLSLSIKEVLVFILPFIIFSIVFNSVSQLQGSGAVRTMTLLFFMVVVSNAFSVLCAHLLGHYVASAVAQEVVSSTIRGRPPLVEIYNFSLPTIVSSMQALVGGLICGTILPRFMGQKAMQISAIMCKISMFILEKVFTPILPVFVVGFVFKIHSEEILKVLQQNAEVVLYIFATALLHTTFLYGVGSNFVLRKTVSTIKSMFPATLLAFSTMSSLVTMPVTLSASKKNSDNPSIMDIVIPASLNIHLIGDCFFIVTMAVLLSKILGTESISLLDHIYFAIYFVISKFAVVAIPGGGVVVMLPIMEKYLHFSPTMLSLITTLYILFDPLITSINVFGNGAFATLFLRIHKLLCNTNKPPTE